MINVKLQGGLGNQMFQYAYTLKMKEIDYNVHFETGFLKKNLQMIAQKDF